MDSDTILDTSTPKETRNTAIMFCEGCDARTYHDVTITLFNGAPAKVRFVRCRKCHHEDYHLISPAMERLASI